MEPNWENKPTIILRFFSNPWVGIVGSIASVIGIFLAIYFYFESVSRPDIVYYTNPVRTIVVQQGTASKLAVLYEGHPLTQDVTAVQIAIWNRGRQAVRRDAVLQPLVIKTNPKVQILEATVKHTSRDVVELAVDQSRVAQGEVPVSWKILEQSDGGVIQLVYAASSDIKIECDGAVEGQRAFHEIKYGRKLSLNAPEVMKLARAFEAVLVVAGVIFWSLGIVVWSRTTSPVDKIQAKMVVIGGVLMIAVFILMRFLSPTSSPPFGFQ